MAVVKLELLNVLWDTKALLVVDTANHKIVEANPTAHLMFRCLTYGELVHKEIHVLVPERFREDHRRLFNEFVKRPRARTMASRSELCSLRFDGTEFPVRVVLTPWQPYSGGNYVITEVFDMTDQGIHEIQLSSISERQNGE